MEQRAAGVANSPLQKRESKRRELDFGALFAGSGFVDEMMEDKQRRQEIIAASGRPRSIEECCAEQREEISEWKGIIQDWQRCRVAAVGRKLERREAQSPCPAGHPPFNKGGVGLGWAESHTSLQEVDEGFVRRLFDERGMEISTSTLYRKWSLFLQMGDVGLLDMRGRKNKGRVSIHGELWGLFEGLYLDENRLGLAKCYEMVHMWAETKKKELLPLPSYSTFVRAAERIPYALTMLYRHGDKAFEDKAAPYIERIYESIEPNDIWVADNHTLDIISRQDGTEIKHRLYLTAYVDARSRMFTGWNPCLSPNSESNLIALRRGIQRCGIPKSIYVDNGREFLTSDIGGRGHRKKAAHPLPPTILDRLGISMTNAIVRNAKAKVIERQFKEVATGFSALFDTYINSNPVARSEKSKRAVKAEDLILDSRIVEYIDVFLEGYYNQKAHHGRGMNGKSPQAVWEELLTVKRMASEEELNLMLLRTTRYQKVGRNGVKLELYGQALWYFDNEFKMYWEGKQVYVRYNPADLRSVRVYDIEDRFIAEVKAQSEMILEYGADNEKISAAMAIKRSYKRYVKDFAKESGIQILKGNDRLDILLSHARGKQRPLDSSGAVTEIHRYNEESAENPLGLAKAVGDIDESAEFFARLRRNVERGRGD